MTIIACFHQYPLLWYFAIILIAMPVGSFLNVLIYRYPLMLFREWQKDFCDFFNKPYEDTLTHPLNNPFNLCKPNSHCPSCKNPVKPWHNIPIVGFMVLGGRCANCNNKISWRYPLVEILSAILCLIVAIHFGVTWVTLAACLCTWLLIAMTFIDIDHQLLPDDLTLLLLWLGLLCNLFQLFTTLENAVIGAMAAYMSLWLVMHLYKLITGKQGMGHGDFKLFAALGAWMGYEVLPFIIILAALLGAIIGCVYLCKTKQGRDTPIPFGPYLAAAGWVALIWGPGLIETYVDYLYSY